MSTHVSIEKLSPGGDGIARIQLKPNAPEKYVLFVPYTAPGEKIEINFTENKKSYGRGIPVRILEKSPNRSIPACPYYFAPEKKSWCGGCNFQHLLYSAQLEEKRNLIQDAMTRIGSLPSIPILPAIAAPRDLEKWRFRNKIQIPFGRSGQEVVSGFYAPSSHQIVPIDDCLIQSEPLMKIVKFITQKMNDWKCEPYLEEARKGWLRHLYIRESSSGEHLVAFITAYAVFSRKEDWIREIRKRFRSVTGICQNIQPAQTNVILGKEWKTLYGQDHLLETLQGLGVNHSDLKLKVSAPSFFQVNSHMAIKLYELVRKFFIEEEPQANESVLDLHCGVGGIALTLAPHCKKVIGVDNVHSSISDAQENSRLNAISNCEFIQQDAAQFMEELEKLGTVPKGTVPDFSPSSTTVILDPPRAGCDPLLIQSLIKLRPAKIIYVSCEPTTLARDIKLLTSSGYLCKKIQPIDLFPQSSHIESVSLLTL